MRMISRFTAEIATAGAATLFGLTIAVGASEFGTGWSATGPEPGTFPFYIGLLIAAAGLGVMAQSTAQRGTLARHFLSAEQFHAVIRFALPIIAYVAISLVLGLYVATALYMFATLRLQNGYPLAQAAAIAVGLPIFLFVVLEYGFSVTLLKGPIEAWFGL
jgi:hypothetical protein